MKVNPLLDLEDAARIACMEGRDGTTAQAVRRWVQRGKLDSETVDGRPHVRLHDLLNVVATRRTYRRSA